MELLGLQNKAINREDFLGVPKRKLEDFCKILNEVLEDYQCGFDLAHKGSLFHYFIVYYRGEGKVNFNSLKYLMDLTLIVNDSSESTMLNLAEDVEDLLSCINCLNFEEHIIGESKIQKYLLTWNKNGNTLLHEWAKKGNFIFVFQVFLKRKYNHMKYLFFCFNFLKYLIIHFRNLRNRSIGALFRPPKFLGVKKPSFNSVFIFFASISGNAEAVDNILELLRDPLPLNKNFETPLDLAFHAGHYPRIREVYVNCGIIQDASDEEME